MSYPIPGRICVIDMGARVRTTRMPDPVAPTSLDVLCGTGMERINHWGNELFSTVVLTYVEKYERAQSKREKMAISKGALDELASKGVRFLKKDPVCQRWYVADSKVGRDRIGHFLRHHLSKPHQLDARHDHMRRVSLQSPHTRPLVALSNNIDIGVGSARWEATGGVASYGGTPNTVVDAPSVSARNTTIFPQCKTSSFYSYCPKEKGSLSGLSLPSQRGVGSCATPPLKGCFDEKCNTSLLDLNKRSLQHDCKLPASTSDAFHSDDSASVGHMTKDSVPSHCLSLLMPYEVGSLESDLHDDPVDLFDDVDLAECLDWQAR